MARTKVFVGNLAFKTRETGLTQEFENAGKVISATIVTRRGRSLGYGFVEFENEAAAAKAVQILNKKEIDGRQVNVEIAKPRDETAPRPQQQGGQGGYRGGQGGFYRGGYRPYRPRGGYPRGGNFYQGGPGYFRGGPRGGFRGGPRGGFRGGQGPRPTPEQKNYQPSSSTLYVTNLPFQLTQEQFTKVFTDAGVKPKSVKIIVKPNGKSKGYGFAEFENSADQQKALTAVDKKTIEGRDIIVKVALVPPTQPQVPQGQTTQTTPAQTQPAQQQQQAKPATTAQPAQQQQQQPAKPVQQQQQQPAQTAQSPKPATTKPETKK